MTAALPADREQRQAFSAGEKTPAPASLGTLGGAGSCDAQRLSLMLRLYQERVSPCGLGAFTGIAHAGAGKDAVPC